MVNVNSHLLSKEATESSVGEEVKCRSYAIYQAIFITKSQVEVFWVVWRRIMLWLVTNVSYDHAASMLELVSRGLFKYSRHFLKRIRKTTKHFSQYNRSDGWSREFYLFRSSQDGV